jgi:hypothetical protein
MTACRRWFIQPANIAKNNWTCVLKSLTIRN